MKAGEVMTRNVVSIGTDASVADMVKLMFDNRISGLPVVDDQGGLVGIVTEGDCLRRAEIGTERKRPRWLELLIGPGRLADEYIHTHSRKVAEVMTQSPITITEDTSLEEVVHLMESRRIKRLPVVRNGKVVGIVSRANLVHALASASTNIPSSTLDRCDDPRATYDRTGKTAVVAATRCDSSRRCRGFMGCSPCCAPARSGHRRRRKHSGRQGRSKPYCLGRSRIGHGDI